MGVVYSAYDTVLERKVAIKVVGDRMLADKPARDLLLHEARAASSLNHPNICTIYEVGDSDGETYIIMEQVEGRPLRSLLGSDGLSPDLVVRYGMQIADALAHAHQHGVIHRDLKSANAVVTPQGRVKVLDFGLATRLQGAELQEAVSAKVPLTESVMIVGTLPYLAPELLGGETADARTDIWALGVLLYEMASGTHPFHGRTAFELSSAILRDAPAPLSAGVPSALGAVILRCLEKSPGDRYQRAKDVHSALESLPPSQSVVLPPEPAVNKIRPPAHIDVVRPKPKAGRVRTWIAVSAAILLAGGASVWFVTTNRGAMSKPRLEERQLTTNRSESGVISAAISPDGRYLAYSDDAGLHIKLVQTGEMRTLSLPAEAPTIRATWYPAAWFPDGTRFLANLDVAGKPPSIWIISLIGDAPRKFRESGFAHSISPDGETIAFTAGRLGLGERQVEHTWEHSDQTIWTIDVNGHAPTILARGDETTGFMHVVWSPDGGRIGYLKIHQTLDSFECAFEHRDRQGGSPVTALTSRNLLQATGRDLCHVPQGFWWGPGGRLVFSLNESWPNIHDFNLWEVKLDAQSGRPTDKPTQITTWVGFSFDHLTGTADGRRLVFVKSSSESTVYVASLEDRGERLTTPRRLTFDGRNDAPTSWTSDSRAVIFTSDRNGQSQIFKQGVDQRDAENIVAGSVGGWIPRTSPDGKSILYLTSTQDPQVGRIMRVRSSGEVAQFLMDVPRLGNMACSRAPSQVCFVAQASQDMKKLIISTFDPLQGNPLAVLTLDARPAGTYNWMPSHDGSRIVLMNYNPLEGRFRLLSLQGEAERDVVVQGWAGFNSVDWAADGKSLFISSESPTSVTLLHVDLRGHATPLWKQRGAWRTCAIAAPDGRNVAMPFETNDGNVWMIENF